MTASKNWVTLSEGGPCFRFTVFVSEGPRNEEKTRGAVNGDVRHGMTEGRESLPFLVSERPLATL